MGGKQKAPSYSSTFLLKLIKEFLMKKNLPNFFKKFTNIDSIKLDEFDLYINSPFVIFEKTNFLNEKLYNELRETFPKKELLTKIEDNGNKISLNNQSSTFNKFTSENKSWGFFYNYLNSKEIILFFCDLIKSELDKIEQRKNLKPFFFCERFK